MLPVLLANEGAHQVAGLGTHDWLILGSVMGVLGFLLVTAIVARGQLGVVPRGLGALYDIVFDWIDDLAVSFVGREGRNYVPLAMSFFLFILFSNWLGLLPWVPMVSVQEPDGHVKMLPPFEAPSTSYSVTLALAIMAFLAFNLLGLRKRVFPPAPAKGTHEEHGAPHEAHANPGGLWGVGVWLAHFIQPVPQVWSAMPRALQYTVVPVLFFFFMGLNFIEEFARILSLSLRLFGNIYGEHAAKDSILVTMFQFLTSGDLMQQCMSVTVYISSLIVTLLGGLAGFIQAMVFMMLLLSYIGHAVADEH